MKRRPITQAELDEYREEESSFGIIKSTKDLKNLVQRRKVTAELERKTSGANAPKKNDL